jgi:hypothetical protein
MTDALCADVVGVVVAGDQRGDRLGFPTVNMLVSDGAPLPVDGVYAGWYARPDGTVLPATLSLAARPRLCGPGDRLLEAHLLGGSSRAPLGERARVRFERALGPQRQFATLEGRSAQFARDANRASRILASPYRTVGFPCLDSDETSSICSLDPSAAQPAVVHPLMRYRRPEGRGQTVQFQTKARARAHYAHRYVSSVRRATGPKLCPA